MNRWLRLALLIIVLVIAGFTAHWWLEPFLAFLGANAATIQTLADLTQLVLWLGAGVVLVVGWWKRPKAASSPQVAGGVIAQGGSAVADHGGVAVVGDVHGDVNPVHIHPDPQAETRKQAARNYLDLLAQRCNVLPLAALGGDEAAGDALTLDQVYVALDTTTPLRTEPGAEPADSEMGRALGQGKERPLTALEAATRSRRIVLLGDPGSGKSTFARQVAANLARCCASGQTWEGWEPGLTPVFTTLRDLAARLVDVRLEGLSDKARDRKLVEVVWEQWRSDLADLQAAAFAEELANRLAQGAVILVFDGLDEVPLAGRGLVRLAVQALLSEYRLVARVLVTCRIRSYHGDARLSGFQDYTLARFDDDKIRQFAHAWYDAKVPLSLTSEQARARGDDLQQAALSEQLQEMASNPMLLTTMALIHQRDVTLPNQRVQLYALAVSGLLGRWQKHKGIAVSEALAKVLLRDENRVREILEGIAHAAHEAQARLDKAGRKRAQRTQPGEEARLRRGTLLELLENPDPPYLGSSGLAGEFLDYVDQRAGLLVGYGGAADERPDRPPQSYDFAHRSFQEYLAGCYMVRSRVANTLREYRLRAGEGDFWQQAALLGAEELLYNRRSLEAMLDLAHQLCPQDAPGHERDWRALLWSGQMAALAGLEKVRQDSQKEGSDAGYLDRLLPNLVRLLEQGRLSAIERADAGNALARLGDPRPGVGLDPTTGLPDLAWCFVPAGPFLMGSNQDPPESTYLGKETPQHTLDLPAFWLSQYPITNHQYHAFVQAGGYKNGHYWTVARKLGYWRDGEVRGYTWNSWTTNYEDGWFDQPADYGAPYTLPNHPVVGVNWFEALAYSEWLTEVLAARRLLPAGWRVRLPSEAEWEKASRGGERVPTAPLVRNQIDAGATLALQPNPTPARVFPWGDDPGPDRANDADSGVGATSAAGCFGTGASPYGCHDLSGNVWEWTRSLWGDDYRKSSYNYPYHPDDGREKLDAAVSVARVLRGGSFGAAVVAVRCAARSRVSPSHRLVVGGFRVLAAPSPSDL